MKIASVTSSLAALALLALCTPTMARTNATQTLDMQTKGKRMRKYHAGLDDHANFPESAAASMGSNGWTYDTNATDWLGYVYPNTGSMPTIQ